MDTATKLAQALSEILDAHPGARYRIISETMKYAGIHFTGPKEKLIEEITDSLVSFPCTDD